ncbi:MAG: RNA polymerase sigma factor, partial [Gemmatimonadales bacterium]
GEPARFESLDALGQRAGWGSAESSQPSLERLADRALIQRALDRLSDEDREVLVLRDLEEFSGDEVAQMTGLTLPATKSRLHRARLRLTAALKEELHADA